MEATTTPKAETKSHRGLALDRELYCPRLERLLMGAASELGLHGSGFEPSGGSTEDPNYAMLRRIGFPNDVDRYGRAHRRHVVGPITDLDRRWRMLSREHQATALARYMGHSRTHESLRSAFGDVAGVVLHRWLRREAASRDRVGRVGRTKLESALNETRAALSPLEERLAWLNAAPRRPRLLDPETRPEGEEELAHWKACQAVLRLLGSLGVRVAKERREAVLAEVKPLREESAKLCAQIAALATGGDLLGGDERSLLDACGYDAKKKRADLLPGGDNDLAKAAATDVREMHRAWYATARVIAKAWVEGGEAA